MDKTSENSLIKAVECCVCVLGVCVGNYTESMWTVHKGKIFQRRVEVKAHDLKR